MCRLNELIPAFLKFLIAETVKLPREKQVLIHRQLVIERKLLRHITDHFLDRFSFADDIVPTDSRRSFGGRQNPTKHADDGRFAGTVRPKKTKNRSPANRERNMIDRSECAEAFRQPITFDHWLTHDRTSLNLFPDIGRKIENPRRSRVQISKTPSASATQTRVASAKSIGVS